MLPGGDAIGRLAIGQLPHSSNIVLVAVGGAYLEAGNGAAFTANMATIGGGYAEAGNAAAFKVSLALITGSYASAGNAALFAASFSATSGAYAENGSAAAFKTVESAAAGAFAWSGFNANEIVFEVEAPAIYLVTGNAAHFTRDFVNWLPVHSQPVPSWSADSAPASSWTPSAGTPATTWTPDNTMTIPPPAAE